MEISLILPSYKNPNCLKLGIEYLIENHFLENYQAEIIVVDDGSPNINEIRSLCSSYPVEFIRLSLNQGKGGAIYKGVSRAKGKYILYTDADCPYTIFNIESIIETLREGKFVCVVGSRIEHSNYYHNISFSRKLCSKAFNYITQIILGLKSIDSQCGLKGFEKDSLLKIIKNPTATRFAFDAELLYRAKIMSFKTKSQPVSLRFKGKSSLNLYLDGFVMLKDLIKIKIFSEKNLRK